MVCGKKQFWNYKATAIVKVIHKHLKKYFYCKFHEKLYIFQDVTWGQWMNHLESLLFPTIHLIFFWKEKVF